MTKKWDKSKDTVTCAIKRALIMLLLRNQNPNKVKLRPQMDRVTIIFHLLMKK